MDRKQDDGETEVIDGGGEGNLFGDKGGEGGAGVEAGVHGVNDGSSTKLHKEKDGQALKK